jgi:hypothetical protein
MRSCAVFLLVCGCLYLAGCSARNVVIANDFKQLGLAYHTYYHEHKKGPNGPDDLVRYTGGDEAGAKLIQKVKDGTYVMIWGVDLRDATKQGAGDLVLGYEKDAPTRGGHVLLLSAEVKQLSAEEFAKARKATPTGSAPK